MPDEIASRPLHMVTSDGAIAATPRWASFLLRIGEVYAASRSDYRRTVVALVLPTRDLAAALITSGITLRRAMEPIGTSNAQAHFEHLCNLPEGTRVIYTSDKVRYKAILGGIEHINGQKGLRLRIAKQYETAIFVFQEKSDGIELAEWEGPLSERISARAIARRTGFLEAALGVNDSREFVTKSRLDAVVIGNAHVLKEEITGSPIVAGLKNGRFLAGTFSELLRVRRLSPNQAYRTDLLSDSNAGSLEALELSKSAIVFDGSNAFLKARAIVRACDWIVVLDRTSSRFLDSVVTLNEEYSRASRQDCVANYCGSEEVPRGVEIMAFQEPMR